MNCLLNRANMYASALLLLAVAATSCTKSNPQQADSTQPERWFPARDSKTRPSLIDLTEYYNAALTNSWQGTEQERAANVGHDLSLLPTGVQTLAGTEFDVRGIVQLDSPSLRQNNPIFPASVRDIQVGLKCRWLHVLHGAGWGVPAHTQVGSYIIHYDDQAQEEIPVVYGENVHGWWKNDRDNSVSPGTTAAWTGKTRSGIHCQLFKTTWPNPRPSVKVRSIDYVSKMKNTAPFLIAITAE